MEWISVKDRLPEFSKEILFYCSSEKMNKFRLGAFYRHSHKFISDGDKYYKHEVSHWMSPEPPNKLERS